MDPVTVLGASGNIGRRVVAHLRAQGWPVIAPLRRPERSPWSDAGMTLRRADFTDVESLRPALADARIIVGCTYASYFPVVLAALPGRVARLVWLGSTRRYTRFPDQLAQDLIAAETALDKSRQPGVILHPTMVYGGGGQSTVQRIAAILRRFGVVPLPAGGSSLIQPIWIDDVAACVTAALRRDEALGPPLVIAGPAAVRYDEFLRAIAAAMGRRARVVPVPLGPLAALAPLTRYLPRFPEIRPDEVRRLAEDKAFSIGPMLRRLRVTPLPLADGLRRMFAADGWSRCPSPPPLSSV
jgi:uncharacterized protein YbjT (DUF2867 family)